MNLGLKDKLVVVGGGAGNLGKAICKTLSEERANVVSVDRETGVDLANKHEVEKFFNFLRQNHPEGLYGYVSSVYGGGGESTFENSSNKQIEEELRNTLLAAVYPVQLAAQWMKEKKEGHIVIVSSTNSFLGLNEFPYDIAKGGINRIAPDVATSMARYGIYATTLLAGDLVLSSGKATSSWDSSKRFSERKRKKVLNRIAASVPDKRFTTTGEMARIITFLLSNDAKPLNGSEIIADRGWHLNLRFKP